MRITAKSVFYTFIVSMFLSSCGKESEKIQPEQDSQPTGDRTAGSGHAEFTAEQLNETIAALESARKPEEFSNAFKKLGIRTNFETFGGGFGDPSYFGKEDRLVNILVTVLSGVLAHEKILQAVNDKRIVKIAIENPYVKRTQNFTNMEETPRAYAYQGGIYGDFENFIGHKRDSVLTLNLFADFETIMNALDKLDFDENFNPNESVLDSY